MNLSRSLNAKTARRSLLLRAACAPACALALFLAPMAHAGDSQVLLGGGAGAAAGAVIGQTMGGNTGAIIGGAIGGATGAAATSHGSRQNGAILGGAVGGAAGAVIGQSAGGRNGAVIGAAAGGAIGAGMGGNTGNTGNYGRHDERHFDTRRGPGDRYEDERHGSHARWKHWRGKHPGRGHGWGHDRD